MKSDSKSFKRFAEVIRQRDELLAALENFLLYNGQSANEQAKWNPHPAVTARAAIARARGDK